jgi:hypothetical protein
MSVDVPAIAMQSENKRADKRVVCWGNGQEAHPINGYAPKYNKAG